MLNRYISHGRSTTVKFVQQLYSACNHNLTLCLGVVYGYQKKDLNCKK